jgi:hypothetical protein
MATALRGEVSQRLGNGEKPEPPSLGDYGRQIDSVDVYDTQEKPEGQAPAELVQSTAQTPKEKPSPYGMQSLPAAQFGPPPGADVPVEHKAMQAYPEDDPPTQNSPGWQRPTPEVRPGSQALSTGIVPPARQRPSTPPVLV